LERIPATSRATGATRVEVEAGASREAAATGEASGASWEPTGTSETTASEAALVTHHAEEDLWVDAAHAAAHATAAKHVGGVHEVVAVVVGGLLPAMGSVTIVRNSKYVGVTY